MFTVKQEMGCHLPRNDGVDERIRGVDVDMAAALDAGHDKRTARVADRTFAEEALGHVAVAVVLEDDLDRCHGPPFFLGIVVEDVVFLFEAAGCLAVETPKERVQQGRLADAVLGIDDGYVPGFVGR